VCNTGSDCFYADGNGALPLSIVGWRLEVWGCSGEKYRLSGGLNVSNYMTNCRLLLAGELKISAEIVP
jgi:hypothetical protein